MSASDVSHTSVDHSLFGSVCDRLEAELHKKVCATMQKAVNDTVCASLKRGIHGAVQGTVAPDTADKARGTAGTLASDICASFEETTSNAVCASLKQVAADTVCKALKDTISTSLHHAGRWDDDIPFQVTPEALNTSCEEILGDAACAALKQVFADTVCKALRKAIDGAIASVVQASEERGFPSLNEMMRAHVSVADAGQLRLSNDGVWYAPEPTTVEELCTIIKQRMNNEVCSRLQQLATSVLCSKVKMAIREEIREHAEQCEHCKNAGRAATRTAARSVLTYKTGMMVMAIIAVAAVAVAAAAPNSPLHFGSTPAATSLSLHPQTLGTNSGSSINLNGMLTTTDGSGVRDQRVLLQRESGGTWTTLGCATTQSDGSFAFNLVQSYSSPALYSTSSAGTSVLLKNGFMVVNGDITSLSSMGIDQHGNTALLYATPPTLGVNTINIAAEKQVSSTGNPYQVTAAPSSINAYVDQSFTISGTVTENGEPTSTGSSDAIVLDRSLDKVAWLEVSHIHTETGSYSISDKLSTEGTYYYRTRFVDTYPGDPYTHATSDVVTVVVSSASPPTAVINLISNPPYLVGGAISLDGSQSTASNGFISTYSWNVSGPSNSSAQISLSDASDPTFIPDQPGEYAVHLTVTDSNRLQGNVDRSLTVSPRASPSPTSSTANPSTPPSPTGQTPPANPTITIPIDRTPSPEGHLYRVSFPGSTQHAASVSDTVRVYDSGSTQSTLGAPGAVNVSISSRLLFA